MFADPQQRELLAYSWYATHGGLSALADWVALRRAQGVAHAAERAAYDAFVDGFVRGGVAISHVDDDGAVRLSVHEIRGDTLTAPRERNFNRG